MNLKLKPRSYQVAAAEQAFKERCATIVLPTGTGKTLVGILWLQKIWSINPNLRVLILEPTRILVEQVAQYYREVAGIEVVKIYGILPKVKRIALWKSAKVVVSTPETAYNDLEFSKEFEVVIVDECHHAIGQDPLLKFLKESNAEWRLGLSAFIPRRYRSEISLYIGKIYEWSARHPEVRKYIPSWLGEIHEAWFKEKEMQLYKAIEQLYFKAKSPKQKMLLRLALKFYARDGLLALRETYLRSRKIHELLKGLETLIFDRSLRELHKLENLKKILDIYDFTKSIIFVDRVIVAERLNVILRDWGFKTVVIKGKEHYTGNVSLETVLQQAKNPQTDVIISTSAGEEGLDLPDADLLVIWSNISEPLRFIQRHGRILRKSKEPKYVTYIVTPETIDLDLLIDAIDFVKRYMEIPISSEVLQKLRRYSPRKKLLAILETPMPLEWIQKLSGLTLAETRRALKIYLEAGELFYIYTHLGKTYFTMEHLLQLYRKFKLYLSPDPQVKLKVKLPGEKGYRALGTYKQAFEYLSKLLPLSGLKVTSIDNVNGVERYHFLSYDFLIPSKTILRIVLSNATSKSTLEIY